MAAKNTSIACPLGPPSKEAVIRPVPSKAEHVSISMPKIRFERYVRLIAARHSAGVDASGSAVVTRLPPLLLLAGVTRERCFLLEAKTPWKHVRLTRGSGTRIATPAMRSSGKQLV